MANIFNKKQQERWLIIGFTDYSCLPNGLVFMFASFSLTSQHKSNVSTFSARICLLLRSFIDFYTLKLNQYISNSIVHEMRISTQHENETIR